MIYLSTRGSRQLKRSAEAILKGISEDGGLYVPEEIPRLDKKLADLVGLSYQEIAFLVLHQFLTDYTDEELKLCVEKAYDEKFDSPDIAPLEKHGDAFFLELYHGKTSAFKDMALSILPHLLTTAMKKEGTDHKIAILTATSGDTGKAALEGFADVPNTEIIVFYPKEGVSLVQERQMVTQEGENTHVYAIRGNFDDAQTGVKNIFNDQELNQILHQKGISLSSANSINIGRLVPQVAYYVYAYVKLLEEGSIKDGEKVNVLVPTGNFGNILAAYYAKQMGIPIHKFLCASNRNKVLTDFLNTGSYDTKREFFVTNSPSMDILISSNLERLLYHLSGGNGEEVAALMETLEQEKRYEVSQKIKSGLAEFYAGFATDKETKEAIGKMYQDHGYLMDTHTGVAYKVYQEYRKETGDQTPTIIASTASPYKFSESVAEAIGLPTMEDGFQSIHTLHDATGVPIPSGLQGLERKIIKHKGVIEKTDLKSAVQDSLGIGQA